MQLQNFPAMRKAFTLIEVLIVIVILGIVMGVGSVRYRDFSRKQTVVNSKRLMQGDIRAAQSDAASGRKPSGCTGNLNGYGFAITGTAGPAEYEIFALCSVEVPVKQVELPAGITLTRNFPAGLTPANTIVFKSLAQGTNLPAGQNAIITITNQGINTDTLTVTASGEVR